MEKEEGPQKKWEGKASEKVKGPRPEQVWPLLRDFFNLHKWLPSAAICYGVEGVSGELGCVRYCSSGSDSGSSWFKDKLVAIDDVQRSLTYEVVDSNVGFKSYKATLKVEDIVEEGENTAGGCVIEWSFELEPVADAKLADFVSMIQMHLQSMARTIEHALTAAKTDH